MRRLNLLLPGVIGLFFLLLPFWVARLGVGPMAPIDTPQTLRSWLYPFFAPHASWFAASSAGFLAVAVLAVAPAFTRRRVLTSTPLFFGVIGGALVWYWYPVLLQGQFNNDESQFLIAAHKLSVDPVFFRAVDCTTSGPLNIAPLLLPRLFGWSPDWASGRVVLLLLLLVTLAYCHGALRMMGSAACARAGLLPVVAFFLTVRHRDYLQFASEYPSMVYLAAAIYVAIACLNEARPNRLAFFTLGALAASLFLAKLQTLPLLAAITGVCGLAAWKRHGQREAAWAASWFGLGAVPLLAVHIAICARAGVLGDFWMSYVRTNFLYSQGGEMEFARRFAALLVATPEFRGYLATTVALALGGIIARRNAGRLNEWPVLLGGLLLAGSLYAVWRPHRFFEHYHLLLILPLGFGAAMMLASVDTKSERIHALAIAALASVMVLAAGARPVEPPAIPATLAKGHDAGYDLPGRLGLADRRALVWGWDPQQYLILGALPATQDSNTINLAGPDGPFWTGVQQNPELAAYYRARFLRDFLAAPPPLVVDVTHPDGFLFTDRAKHGYASMPELKTIVERDYHLVGDDSGRRFFVKKTIAPAVAWRP